MVDTRPDVAIFWDFETCPANPSSSGYAIVDNVRSLALRFGLIKSFKAYLAVSDQQNAVPGGHSRALALRSELQSSGVTLTDVPYGKDAIGKTLLVDMLAYAFDRLPATVVPVVITADHLLAYALSVLRMRSYQVVLLTSETVSSSVLISQAAVCFNWNGSDGESDFTPPTAPPRTHSKGKEKARSSEEKGERLAADYGAASSQWGPTATSTLPNGAASPSKAASSGSDGEKEVDIKDYLPERMPLQGYGENLNDPVVNSKNIGATDDENEIVLSVPDSDEEEDLAVAISLSEAENAEKCLKQEEEELQHALTQSMLEREDLSNGGGAVDDGALATSSKVMLDSDETSVPLTFATPSPSLRSVSPELSNEGPPAYTAHHYSQSPHLMQPSELTESAPSSPTTSPLLILQDPPSCDSPPARPSSTPNPEWQDTGFIPATPVTVTEPTPSPPVVEEPVQMPSPPRSSFSNPRLTEELPASNVPPPSNTHPARSTSPSSPGESIPKHYNVLVEVMEEYRQQGVTSVRRAFLGEQLPKRQPNVYAQAALDGTAKPLKNYIDHAITAGILVRESVENVSLAKAHIPQAPKPASTPGPSNSTPTGPAASGSARPRVPPHFRVLVELMAELRDKGFATPSRGYLGFILPQRQPSVYAAAGCFASGKTPASRKYIDAAIEAGLLKQESNGTHVSLVPLPEVPVQFSSLALVMKQQHARGLKRVNRTLLSNELLKAQSNVYVQAGFGNMSKPMLHYLDAAVDAGILIEWQDSTYSLSDIYR